MGLTTSQHSNPYKIWWIKKGNKVRVQEVCKIPFSIGKFYLYEVQCDIVDMYRCQILLRHPWKFKMDALHKEKMFTFFPENVKKNCIISI